MAGFSNTTVAPPRASKPHLVLRGGWWRVSTLYQRERIKYGARWNMAHAAAERWNNARRS